MTGEPEKVWQIFYRSSDHIVADEEIAAMDGPLSERILSYILKNKHDFIGQTSRVLRLTLFKEDGRVCGDVISIWERECRELPKPDWDRCLGVMKYLAENLGGTLLRNKEGTRYLLVIDDQAIQ